MPTKRSQIGRRAVTKGKVGERAWAAYLRTNYGWTAKRGQQHAGGVESPGVLCEELKGVHGEVKYGYPIRQLDLHHREFSTIIVKAAAEAMGGPWYIAWKPLGHGDSEWRVTALFHNVLVTVWGRASVRSVLDGLRQQADARLPLTTPTGATP